MAARAEIWQWLHCMAQCAWAEKGGNVVKILYIFPRTTPDSVEREAEHARRRAILQRAVSPGTVVDIRELEHCPPAIESRRDEYAVAPGIIAMAETLERKYDAMVVGCFSDPAVDGALEGRRSPSLGARSLRWRWLCSSVISSPCSLPR